MKYNNIKSRETLIDRDDHLITIVDHDNTDNNPLLAYLALI